MKKIGYSVYTHINKNWKYYFVGLLMLQLIVLLGTLLHFGIDTTGDAPTYMTPAHTFLESGKMLNGKGEPILFRTPGYPLFLAILYFICGSNNCVVVCVQFLMTLSISTMIFFPVQKYTNSFCGICALLFYILDFSTYCLTSSILTDLPFSFLIVLALVCFLKFIDTKKYRYLLGTAVIVNFSMLVRPNIVYFNMLISILLVILMVLRKVKLKYAITFVSLFIIIYGGWSLRNMPFYGTPVYTTIRAESTFKWYAPCVYADENNCSEKEAGKYFSKELYDKYPEFDGFSKKEKVEAYKDIGTNYIYKHKWGYIKLNIKGLFKEMFGPNWVKINALTKSTMINKLIALIVVLSLGGLYCIYAVIFLCTFKQWKWYEWLILFLILYFMASTAVLGYSRFRLPFYPLCIVSAFTSFKHKFKFDAPTKNVDSKDV